MTNIDHILICKTNIRTETEKRLIQKCLDAHAEIEKWNLDQQDIDCVLRVVSSSLSYSEIISIITQHGFDCVELD